MNASPVGPWSSGLRRAPVPGHGSLPDDGPAGLIHTSPRRRESRASGSGSSGTSPVDSAGRADGADCADGAGRPDSAGRADGGVGADPADGPGAPMGARGPLGGVDAAALTRALTPLLDPVLGEEAHRAANRASAAILPAVEALGRLRGEPGLTPWDGLVHRRCLVTPGEDGSATAQPGVRITRLKRAGWEITTARTTLRRATGNLSVTHELARALSSPAATGPRARADEAHGGPLTSSDRLLHLGRPQVAAWARASGDDNALHLEPGAARRAGLAAAGHEVVAHGLMLAALSLALVPPGPTGAYDMRFTAPLPVPGRPGGAPVSMVVDTVGGDVRHGGRTVLRRR
ncbi:MaoC/PaaZ C-terminal domain-containing protein [Actinomyces oricola]|uniref:MaoC/PaaZ C-terminal domain-containing protein n=1 Tax=Actinomyces oricola TaxID=206043 RepID=UPI000FFEB852|nr:MaoC/PaaZ C-terminal domain-containing protein [Actinomyces oricola]